VSWDALDEALDGQAARLIRARRPYLSIVDAATGSSIRCTPEEWWETLDGATQMRWAESLGRTLAREM